MRFLFVTVMLFALSGCNGSPEGLAPPLDRLDYPIATAIHPDGRYLYVVNAALDRKYRSGTVRVVDLETSAFLNEAVLEIDLFAGELALMENGGRIYGVVASRDTQSLLQFEIKAGEGDAASHLGSIRSYADFGPLGFEKDPMPRC